MIRERPITFHLRNELVPTGPTLAFMLPFEPKMMAKSELHGMLFQVMSQVEAAVLSHYPMARAEAFLNKLKRIIGELNYHTHRKSLLVLLSEQVEKIFYLDIRLQQNVFVDTAFSMRQLAQNKRPHIEYLVLELSDSRSRIFDVDQRSRVKLILDQRHAEDYSYLDQGLSILLRVNPLPLFVVGSRQLLRLFHRVTSNMPEVVKFVCTESTVLQENQVASLLSPYVSDWLKTWQSYLVHRLLGAQASRALVTGFEKVREAVIHDNNGLLLIDPDLEPAPGTTFSQRPFYIRDAVDELIELALSRNDEVEWLKRGTLSALGRVAYIRKKISA